MRVMVAALVGAFLAIVGPLSHGQDLVAGWGFDALHGNEILTYTGSVQTGRGTLVLYGIDPETQRSRELAAIGDFDMGKVQVVENGTKAYFIVVSEEGPRGVTHLWVADGRIGLAYPLLSAGASFAVSSDGKTICYEDVEYEAKNHALLPRIDLYDVGSGKVRTHIDCTDPRYRGTEIIISFLPGRKAFHLAFEIEGGTVGAQDIAAE